MRLKAWVTSFSLGKLKPTGLPSGGGAGSRARVRCKVARIWKDEVHSKLVQQVGAAARHHAGPGARCTDA